MAIYSIMKWKNKFLFWSFFSLALFQIVGCQSEYSRLVRKELAFGGTHNELLFDLEIGQKMQDFFDRCTALNKAKKITQGSGIFARQELIPTENDGHKIEMLFYGISNPEKTLTGMDLRFSYIGWSPWNKNLQSNMLMAAIKDSMQLWFPGNPFIEVDSGIDNKVALIKVDGNRRIRMIPIDKRQLGVKIEDISGKYKN